MATDANPGTSPLLAPLLALNMACVLFGLTAEEALAGMTRVAAQALGLDGPRHARGRPRAPISPSGASEQPAELCYWLGLQPLELLVKDGSDGQRRRRQQLAPPPP